MWHSVYISLEQYQSQIYLVFIKSNCLRSTLHAHPILKTKQSVKLKSKSFLVLSSFLSCDNLRRRWYRFSPNGFCTRQIENGHYQSHNDATWAEEEREKREQGEKNEFLLIRVQYVLFVMIQKTLHITRVLYVLFVMIQATLDIPWVQYVLFLIIQATLDITRVLLYWDVTRVWGNVEIVPGSSMRLCYGVYRWRVVSCNESLENISSSTNKQKTVLS